MKFITFSLAALSFSAVLAEDVWSGTWKVTPVTTDPSCCFPKSPIILQSVDNLSQCLIEGSWDYSSGCRAIQIAVDYLANVDVSPSSSELNFDYDYLTQSGSVKIENEGQSLTLSTEFNGQTCQATLTKDQ